MTTSSGPDTASYRLRAPAAASLNNDRSGGPTTRHEPVDEINDYWKARYLSAGEAAWRIMGFHVCKKEPSVTSLAIHLPSATSHHQYFRRNNTQSTLSTIDHYFLRPPGNYLHDGQLRSFSSLTYIDYYQLFRLAKYDPTKEGNTTYYRECATADNPNPMHVIKRTGTYCHLSRIHSVSPAKGEVFYLRSLLLHRSATSYVDLRTINNLVYPSFQDAASQLGLFADEQEAHYAISEAIDTLKTPRQLRVLFVHLLVNDCVPSPLSLWRDFRSDLSRDFTLRAQNDEALGTDSALRELGSYLEEYGRTLADFGLPTPISFSTEVLHELHRWRDHTSLQNSADSAASSFNAEQAIIFNDIIQAVQSHSPLLCFVDGKAGRGKTFLVKAICNRLRAQEKIVLASATSAFAAQQYPGGRTTHATFKVRRYRY